MEKIDTQLKNASFVESPVGLHQQVMKRINYWHYLRPILFVLLIMFLFNFIIMAWHINGKLIDAEFKDMIMDFWESLDFNFSIKASIGSFFEIISPELIISLILSLIGLVYVIKKMISLKLVKKI